MFKIDHRDDRILDMSIKGLRFINDSETDFGENVAGEICYKDGDTRSVEGKIIWKQGEELGLAYLKSGNFPQG